MMQAYAGEIGQLKEDLQEARAKKGVFVEKSTYDRVMDQLEAYEKDSAELLTIVKGLEEKLEKKEEELANTQATLVEFQEANEILRCTQLELRRPNMKRDENKLSRREEEISLQNGTRSMSELAENIGNFRTEHAKLSGSQLLHMESFLQTKNTLFENVKEELAAFFEDLENKLNNVYGLSADQGNQVENWCESLTLSDKGYSQSQSQLFTNFLHDSEEAFKKTEACIENMQRSYSSTMNKVLKHCKLMENEVNHFTEYLLEGMNDQDRRLDELNSDIYAYKKSTDAFRESIKNSMVVFQTEFMSILQKNEELERGAY